jgi:hypothetical protein
VIKGRNSQLSVVMLAVALALAAALLPGCATTLPVKMGPTALENLSVARSALSTTAPDAKLMSVRTYQPTAAAEPPAWIFLFGSPAMNTLFRVYVTNGKLVFVQNAGGVGLASSAWASVPGTDVWTVDSDAAYARAVAASKAGGTPASYVMGFETIKSSMDASAPQPYVWRVTLYSGATNTTMSTVDVNATTGAASIVK